MNKRICLFLLVLLMLLTLCGCRKDEPEEVPATTQPQLQKPTEPDWEELIYFQNSTEFDRLYSIRPDGSGLTLVLDEFCANVSRQGDTVFFLASADLISYHIPTKERTVFRENVLSFMLDGSCMAYITYSRNMMYLQLHVLDLVSGRDTFVSDLDTMQYCVSDGVVYFTEYDKYGTCTPCSFDPATGIRRKLFDRDIYGYTLFAMNGQIMFRGSVGEEYRWIITNTDGTETFYPSGFPEESCEPFYIGEKGILFIHYDYTSETPYSICRLTPEGKCIVLASAEDNGDFRVASVAKDKLLVCLTSYVPWGPMNEYGYYESYSNQYTYWLLDASGAMREIDTGDQLYEMFSKGDFPILDSSTAREPVVSALYSLFVKNHGHSGPEPLCSTTHGAWINIADGTVDLALLAAPTPEEQAYLERKGVEVDMKLYGGDGLLFIGNVSNPVTDLSHEQILAIYCGQITNWKELGGPDHAITVYFRDDQSGSQRLFEELVFWQEEMPDFYELDFEMMDAMSTIVDTVAQDPYSIGYTIMTYLSDDYGSDSVRVFSVDGVEPSAATVADATYRYHTQGFLVIRSDEPKDSGARRLYEWFGCPVSDRILENNGITPLSQ